MQQFFNARQEPQQRDFINSSESALFLVDLFFPTTDPWKHYPCKIRRNYGYFSWAIGMD